MLTLSEVFDAEENKRMRTLRDDINIMHTEFRIGDSTDMFADITEKFPVSTAGLFKYLMMPIRELKKKLMQVQL